MLAVPSPGLWVTLLPLALPPLCHEARGTQLWDTLCAPTSGPFLLDFLLKDALFFFLLALRVFCEKSKGVHDRGAG